MPQTPKRGEIFWVAFDPSIGGEAQKTRPAIVISNNDANRRLNRILVIPLTSNIDKIFPGETLVAVNGKSHKAVASQTTTVSKLRVGDRFGVLSDEDMWHVENSLILHAGLDSDQATP
jgi:mRNA interferase MazF